MGSAAPPKGGTLEQNLVDLRDLLDIILVRRARCSLRVPCTTHKQRSFAQAEAVKEEMISPACLRKTYSGVSAILSAPGRREPAKCFAQMVLGLVQHADDPHCKAVAPLMVRVAFALLLL